MARRQSRKARGNTQANRYPAQSGSWGHRKSDAEARVERFTWFLLVILFATLNMLPAGSVPNAFVPISGAIILLGSGMYQYFRRWHVSPVTWIAGSIMLVLGLYNLAMDPTRDFLGLSLIAFAIVIGFGVLTGET